MTSPIEMRTVKCPVCGEVYETAYRASVNVSLDPWATDEYIASVQSGTCSNGHTVDLGGLVVRPDGTWEMS